VHYFSLSGCVNVGAIVYLPYEAVGPINLKPLIEAATEAILLYDSIFGLICASAHLADKVT
jgi:hypothetical protein